MSTKAKWILIVLLFVVVHTVFMAAVAAGLVGGEHNYIVPFGSIDYTRASSIAKIEGLLAFPLLLGFAVALLRDSE